MAENSVARDGAWLSERDRAAQLDITPELLKWRELCSYAAGLFEGEGCIIINRSPRANSPHYSHQLHAFVKMGDMEPLETLQAQWPGTLKRYEPETDRRRAMWLWTVWSGRAASFLADIYPFLYSVRLRTKAEVAMAFQAQKKNLGRGTTSRYRDVQRSYFDAMRTLNVRGDASLSTTQRFAVVEALGITTLEVSAA